MLLLAGIVLLAVAFVLVGDVLTLRVRERQAMVGRVLARPPTGADLAQPALPGFGQRVLAPLARSLERFVLRFSRGTTTDTVRKRLLAAGLSPASRTTYLATKAALGVGGLLLGVLLAAAGAGAAGVALGFTFAGLGYLFPDISLSRRARRRQDSVQAELPNLLDLLVVSIEAGLGFDAAVRRTTEGATGPLAEELRLALSEMRIGRRRHETLRAMADRVDSPDIQAFVRAVIQADELGISLSRTLAVQAEEARRRRQAAVEEQAMKAPVKMLFPTVIFIFPSLFVVILGPAFLGLADLF